MYSNTDSFVYNIKHLDIHEWIEENKRDLDLTDYKRIDMHDSENKKKL